METKVLRGHVVTEQAQLVIGKLFKAASEKDMSTSHVAALVKFNRKAHPEHADAGIIFQKIKSRLENKDPEANKEWKEYLNVEFEIKKLPAGIGKWLPEIKLADYMALEPIVEGGHVMPPEHFDVEFYEPKVEALDKPKLEEVK